MVARPYKFTMLMSQLEHDAARHLAAIRGFTNVSDYIRHHILQELNAMNQEAQRIRTDVLWLLKLDAAQKTTDLMQNFVGRYPVTGNLGSMIAATLEQLHKQQWASGSPAEGYKLTKRGENARKSIQ